MCKQVEIMPEKVFYNENAKYIFTVLIKDARRMKQLIKLLILPVAAGLIAICLGTGCMSWPGGITSSTIPITAKDSYVIIQKDVAGSDWSIGLLNNPIPPLNPYTALQNAKKKSGADALINVTAKNEVYWPTIFPLITYHRTQIRGDAIKFVRGGE